MDTITEDVSGLVGLVFPEEYSNNTLSLSELKAYCIKQ